MNKISILFTAILMFLFTANTFAQSDLIQFHPTDSSPVVNEKDKLKYAGSCKDIVHQIDDSLLAQDGIEKIDAVFIKCHEFKTELENRYCLEVESKSFECKMDDYLAYFAQISHFAIALQELESFCNSRNLSLKLNFNKVIFTPKNIGQEIVQDKKSKSLIIVEVDEDTFPTCGLGNIYDWLDNTVFELLDGSRENISGKNTAGPAIWESSDIYFDVLEVSEIKEKLYKQKLVNCE